METSADTVETSMELPLVGGSFHGSSVEVSVKLLLNFRCLGSGAGDPDKKNEKTVKISKGVVGGGGGGGGWGDWVGR